MNFLGRDIIALTIVNELKLRSFKFRRDFGS